MKGVLAAITCLWNQSSRLIWGPNRVGIGTQVADHATNVWTDLASPLARYELRCWGQFALFDRIDRQDRSPRSRKGRAIIAHLWSLGGAPINRERLAGLLWSERGDEQARGSLRQSLFQLKELTSGKRTLLIVERDQIRLNPNMLASDVARIELLARFGNLKELTRALADKGDRLFEGLDGLDPAFDDWLAVERSKQLDRVIECGVDAANSGLASGATDEVRRLVSCLQHLDEANETIARIGMRADHAAGEAGAANLRFQKLRGVLGRELHVEPSGETRSLFQALASPSLAAPPALETGRGVEVRRAGRAPRRRAPVFRRAQRVWLLLVALVAVLGALLLWQRGSPMTANEPVSIAVIPFRNMSAGKEHYLAEGFSDEILGRLARNPNLEVLGRSSASMYADGELDSRSIGRRLNVDYLLEGNIRVENRQMRVLVSLVRTKDGVLLWSERYDRPLDDILAVQDEIGAAVALRLNKEASRGAAAGPQAEATRAPQASAEWHIMRSLGASGRIEEVRRLLQPDGDTWNLMRLSRRHRTLRGRRGPAPIADTRGAKQPFPTRIEAEKGKARA